MASVAAGRFFKDLNSGGYWVDLDGQLYYLWDDGRVKLFGTNSDGTLEALENSPAYYKEVPSTKDLYRTLLKGLI